jgi:hypothetical protein
MCYGANLSISGMGLSPGFLTSMLSTSQVIEPSWGPTRNEADCLAHLQRLIGSDATATKWHLLVDNLNIHQSESLVRWIAEIEGISQDELGVKGKNGILRSMATRAAFLHDAAHKVVFYYTPKHARLHEPGRNLVEHSGAQIAQTWEFSLTRRFKRADSGVYYLLQSNDGPSI